MTDDEEEKFLDWCCENKVTPLMEAALAWQAATPKWISVDNALPKKGTPVLTSSINKDGFRFTPSIRWVEKNGWAEEGFKVTHWMPLPDSP